MILSDFKSTFTEFFSNYYKYIKWLLFTGVIAIFPIGLDFLFRKMSSHTVSFTDLFGDGQLLLISCALCASGLGEIFSQVRRNDENVFERLLTGFSGTVFLLLSSAGYGYISASITSSIDMSILISIEIFAFLGSFFIGLIAQKFS